MMCLKVYDTYIYIYYIYRTAAFMVPSSPLLRRSPGPPLPQFCNRPSGPVCPADGTCTAPPPVEARGGGCQAENCLQHDSYM